MVARDELIETRIHPDILNTIGKSFRFRHSKGVAEWLKNSLDNYHRLVALGKEPMVGSWPVYLALVDGLNRATGPNLAVIDFGGATLTDIQEFFLYWGSSSAAILGGAAIGANVTGGHGNGGKFYMREMWRGGAHFLTCRDGKATYFSVEKRTDGKTGRWFFRDRPMTWREALSLPLSASEHMGGADYIIRFIEENQPLLAQQLDAGIRGITAVVGYRAEQTGSANDVLTGGRWNAQKLVDEILDTPQARRPIRETAISIFHNRQLVIEHLKPHDIEEDPEWPEVVVELPVSVLAEDTRTDATSRAGMLRVKKAVIQLTGRSKDYNSVFINDNRGNPIASYPMRELALPGHSPVVSFMFAELDLMFPEIESLVENDRERLVRTSPTTGNILDWVAQQIWDRVAIIDQAQREQLHLAELSRAVSLNNELNRHARQFLQEVQSQIFVDLIQDSTGGGLGKHEGGTGPTGIGHAGDGRRQSGSGGGEGEGGTREIPGHNEPSRQLQLPKVLLSGVDADPANPGTTKYFTDRHPPLEQDDVDKRYNVWWINTAHPFAKAALDRGGAEGYAFKMHQLFMFRDMVQRETLRYQQRREAELGLDRVENDLSEMSNQFLGALSHDLLTQLLG